MMRAVTAALLLAACNTEDLYVEIVKPADGTMITTHDPIVFDIDSNGVQCCDLYVDGNWVNNGDYQFATRTWTAAQSVVNGPHEIRLVGVNDLVDYSDEITLVFARP